MSVSTVYIADCPECGQFYETDIEGDADEWNRQHEDGNCDYDA